MASTASFGTRYARLAQLPPAYRDAIVLTLICTVGFAVRFSGIADKVMWYDETVSWSQARLGFIDMLRATSWDNYPPLHNMILNAVIHFISDSETALRFPSALLGTLNIALIYALGRILGNSTAGLLAAVLLALSPFHIWYSQEARAYTLLAFCATLLVLAMLMALRTENWRWYAMSAFAAMLLLYTHPYGALLWGSLGVAILLCAALLPAVRARHFKLIAWQMLPAACFAPWAYILVKRTEVVNEGGFWIPYPTLSFLREQFQTIAYSNMMLTIAVLAILVALLWPLPRRGRASASSEPDISGFESRAILIAWLAGPFVIGLTISLISQPVLVARYLICSLPAATLLIALGFSRVMVNKALSVASIAILLVGVVFSLQGQQYPEYRPDWRSAAAAIRESFRPGDCIAAVRNFGTRPFTYYSREFVNCVVPVENLRTFDAGNITSSRLWLVTDEGDECSSDPASRCWTRGDIENAATRLTAQGWEKLDMREWQWATVVLLERRGS